jgi:hypothetical protein
MRRLSSAFSSAKICVICGRKYCRWGVRTIGLHKKKMHQRKNASKKKCIKGKMHQIACICPGSAPDAAK